MKIEISTTPPAPPDRPDVSKLLATQFPLAGDDRVTDVAAVIDNAFKHYEKADDGSRDVCIVIRCTDHELQTFIEQERMAQGSLIVEVYNAALDIIPHNLGKFRTDNVEGSQ